MPKKTVHFKRFTNGLYLGSDVSEMPEGTTRRNRSIHPVLDGLYRTREGSAQLHALNAAHSLVYFDDRWYSGVSTDFYSETDVVKQSLSGDRLAFTAMPPTAGQEDYLFVAGGDDLFKVGDYAYSESTELITNGTMEADANWSNYGTPATNERSTTQIYADSYSRKFTPDAANEGIESDVLTASTVALNWYKVTCQVFPDDGTTVRIRVRNGADDDWAYNTLHTGLTQDKWNEITFTYQEASGKGGAGAYIVFESDTSTSGDWYIDEVMLRKAHYAVDWGIDIPAQTMGVADGGAGGNLDDGAVYKYRLTYYNDQTGSRSDPAVADSSTKLLLHCDGADTSTTFTDNGASSHTVTATGNAQLDTAQKKFGTASGLFDGTGDYLSIATHADFNFGSNAFTIDFWLRFNAQATAMLFEQYSSSSLFHSFYYYPGTSRLYWNVRQGGSESAFHAAWSPANDTWYHVAAIRGWDGDTNTWAIVVDGTALDTNSSSFSIPDVGAAFTIGGSSRGYSLNGWIDEFRILKGTAAETSTFTPPTVAYANSATIDLAGGSTSVDLTNIPASEDAQVSHVEIWRTAGGGSSYLYLTALASGTTTYTDNTSDDELLSTELPTDNAKPYTWFDDCFGPYNASMFWITRTQAGERGRVYYSPVGRAEAMDGFIEVATDDLPLQKGVMWKDTPFVFGEAGVYQIAGTNPYFSRRMGGVPGTTKPHTVIETPIGIMYEAQDAVRVFNGSSSAKASKENIQLLFRGQSAGALSSFDGVVACYGRGEYLISDETQLIACDVGRGTWRDIGDLAAKSLHYAEDADIIGAGTNADGIYDLEKEGETDDNSNDINIDLETNHIRIGDDKGGLVKQILVDHQSGDASGETLTVYLEHDGSETNLGTISQFNRGVDVLHVNRMCNEFGIRITGAVDDWVKIYRVSAEVYLRQEELE